MGHIHVFHFVTGETIVRQDDEDYTLYKILMGRVGLYRNYGTDSEIELGRLNQGRCFGEMALLEHRPRLATVVALEETSVMMFTEKHLRRFIRFNPGFALELMRSMSSMVRYIVCELEEACVMVEEINKSQKTDKDKRIKEFMEKHMLNYENIRRYFVWRA